MSQVLITRDDGLHLLDLDTGKETKLVSAPAGTFITYPAWSPDGKRIAYVVSRPFQPNGDWGDDLYTADVDGRNVKLTLKHDAPGATIESPSWMPDGASLLVGYIRLVFDARGQFQDQIHEVRRVSVNGSMTTLLRNAGQPQLCPDGSSFAFVGFDSDSNTWDTVGIARADGADARMLVTARDGPLVDYAPHPAPDCRTLVFAAVGGAAPAPTPAAGLPAGQKRGVRVGIERPGRAPDGSPWDLWTVAIDGSGLRQITHVGEDMPYPSWSADGKRLLCIGTNGLYELNADGSGLHTVAQGVMHGQIAWRQAA